MHDHQANVIAYHQATKHRFEKTADGPGFLDWMNLPEPFRHYAGTVRIPLDDPPPGEQPRYDG